MITGIPKDISFDGLTKKGQLCKTNPRNHGFRRAKPEDCKPMTKTFFLQV